MVCLKCGEAWEAAFVACWKCGYEPAAETSDDPAGGDQETVTGETKDEEAHLLPAPLLPALEWLSQGRALLSAEIVALHESGRDPIIDWMMFAGLAWLTLLVLVHPVYAVVFSPILLVLHLVMLAGVAAAYLFRIALAVTASLAATQAMCVTMGILRGIPVLIEEPQYRGYVILMMVAAAAVVGCELMVMLKAIALRREVTRLRQTSSPPSPL